MSEEELDYNAGYSDGYAAAKEEELYEPAEPMSEEEQFKEALDAAVACCPDGWQVVPVMPTTEMINAFANYIKDWYGRPVDYQRGADAWTRILAASQKELDKP